MDSIKKEKTKRLFDISEILRKNKDIPYYNFLSPLINEAKQIIDSLMRRILMKERSESCGT